MRLALSPALLAFPWRPRHTIHPPSSLSHIHVARKRVRALPHLAQRVTHRHQVGFCRRPRHIVRVKVGDRGRVRGLEVGQGKGGGGNVPTREGARDHERAGACRKTAQKARKQ